MNQLILANIGHPVTGILCKHGHYLYTLMKCTSILEDINSIDHHARIM